MERGLSLCHWLRNMVRDLRVTGISALPQRKHEENAIFVCSLGIQSPCEMMIGVYNHLLSKVFRFH